MSLMIKLIPAGVVDLFNQPTRTGKRSYSKPQICCLATPRFKAGQAPTEAGQVLLQKLISYHI